MVGATGRATSDAEQRRHHACTTERHHVNSNSPSSSSEFVHLPVMAAEIVRLFATVPAGWVLDATLGGGGHSELLLEAHPHLSVLGIDRDPSALAAATRRLARFGDRFIA